ncbi:MAG: hypothetical protein QN174_09080 [Armatimonadota bacterium]|nr:hypothetical protein [Armatimonadota bacterium]MDR7453239.1 hypothetical protein [Armatimonadota bacterium]MDR7455855.1 hypothetical protein [Armatimonadota bacterium]MDR7497096.1 hypothetical protein [Armatimonadota bacterium]MDR7511914.1 hypothetical protein [Armatimonadota bacterium]
MRSVERGRPRAGAPGFTTLESLVALLLIVAVVVLTGRVIVTTLTLVGRGANDELGARLRSQATAWTQGVVEYTRKLGFPALVAECPTVPCSIPLPAGAGSRYAQAPALPLGFQCGVVRLADWDGAGGRDPSTLRLVTVEIFTNCPGGSPGGPPFLIAHTGMAARVPGP